MSHLVLTVLACSVIIVVIFIQVAIFASRYARVGPNQALIISGRKIPRPDGTFARFRIVKGGGTFVWPVIETAAVLSLEVRTVEMPRSRVRLAKGGVAELDCTAQVKIKGDDASIAAAAEHFLSKSDADLKNMIRPVLEKNLSAALGDLSLEDVSRGMDACAARVLSAAAGNLSRMELDVVSFSLRDVRAA